LLLDTPGRFAPFRDILRPVHITPVRRCGCRRPLDARFVNDTSRAAWSAFMR
jgi:hypothetical protein